MSGISVTGGAAGLAADYADLLRLASTIDEARAALQRLLDNLAAPALELALSGCDADPAGAATAAEVSDELGRLSLPWGAPGQAAAQLQRCRDGLFAAVQDYQHTDGLIGHRIADTLDGTVVGRLAGLVGEAVGVPLAPAAVVGHAALLGLSGHPVTALQALLTDDPADVDTALRLTGAVGLTTLAGALPENPPEVRALGVDRRPAAAAAPRSLTDLVREIALRDTGHNGEVSVSFLHGADGRRRVVVDVPGTKSWNPVPTHDVTSVTTDLRAMAGATTSYERGIFQALRRAGVTPADPIMLVGHSEGGIVAVDAARHADPTRWTITHVVTAGAPIGVVARTLPATVQVLAIENAADVVPHLDGEPNPVTAAITTATVDTSQSTILGAHGLGTGYLPAAEQLDAATDPSVRAFLAGAAGFLTPAPGSRARTVAYWIRRQ